MPRRIIIYPILLFFTLLLLLAPKFLLNPHRNLRAVSSQIAPASTKSHQILKSFGSFAVARRDGYTITFNTKHASEFSPAEFVVISKVRDVLIVELLVGPGEEGVIRYEGQVAREYIDSHGIDLEEFEKFATNAQ